MAFIIFRNWKFYRCIRSTPSSFPSRFWCRHPKTQSHLNGMWAIAMMMTLMLTDTSWWIRGARGPCIIWCLFKSKKQSSLLKGCSFIVLQYSSFHRCAGNPWLWDLMLWVRPYLFHTSVWVLRVDRIRYWRVHSCDAKFVKSAHRTTKRHPWLALGLHWLCSFLREASRLAGRMKKESTQILKAMEGILQEVHWMLHRRILCSWYSKFILLITHRCRFRPKGFIWKHLRTSTWNF